jgi:hypothetical protein
MVTKTQNSWKRITKELDRRVLVTNNIRARDAKGRMSHVWIGIPIKSSEPDKYGKFTTFTDSDQRICDLTHYCEIPQGSNGD